MEKYHSGIRRLYFLQNCLADRIFLADVHPWPGSFLDPELRQSSRRQHNAPHDRFPDPDYYRNYRNYVQCKTGPGLRPRNRLRHRSDFLTADLYANPGIWQRQVLWGG